MFRWYIFVEAEIRICADSSLKCSADTECIFLNVLPVGFSSAQIYFEQSGSVTLKYYSL